MGQREIWVRKLHELKTWPPFFQSILDGTKTFELREDDRGFEVGDVIALREYDPKYKSYTAREVRRLVVYKLDAASFCGLTKGWCVLGLGPLSLDIKVEIATSSNIASPKFLCGSCRKNSTCNPFVNYGVRAVTCQKYVKRSGTSGRVA